MHKTSNSSRISTSAVSSNANSYIAWLRRLKIQEGILSANVNKTYNEYVVICNGDNKSNNDKDFKKYFCKLKDSYIDIKNLYEDIKVKTNFPETLEMTDINDLKKDILELEDKIRCFKQFLKEELKSMQAEENSLRETDKGNNVEERKNIQHSKIQTKNYNEIVPSPVRVMINTPLKCLEVHQFQEFMKNSPNRYGGWNEYNHNLFVQIWNKYNGNAIFTSQPIGDTHLFQEFKDEALQKISGTRIEDIDSHTEWYSQYIYFKMSQQKALDKWKENKIKIKKPFRESKVHSRPFGTENKEASIFVDQDKLHGEALTDTVNNEIDLPRKLDVSRLVRPTKQWLNRCESDKETSKLKYNIESISKLGVPAWRHNLKCTGSNN